MFVEIIEETVKKCNCHIGTVIGRMMYPDVGNEMIHDR